MIEVKVNKFYMEGKKLKHTELKNLLSSNIKALKLFQAGQTKGFVGGLLLGTGVGLMLSDFITAVNSIGASYPRIKTTVGAAFVVVSVPVMIWL